jgi:guanosine-3',5'-bis(diphosphate) 3'-pyrophosphohydrolase
MFSQDLYKRALDFAARAHADQKEPGHGFPYVVHLAKVAMETIAACESDPTLDGDVAIPCALLHDTIEDAGVSEDAIRETFGDAVARGVSALTKDPSLPKESQMRDSLERIKKQPRDIWAVKLADRITNLEPPPARWNEAKRRKYQEEARQIREHLRGASELLERRIEEKIAAYDAHLTPLR